MSILVTNMKKSVIFICTNNAARSQIAEGYLRAKYSDKYEVYSAGTEPSQINSYSIMSMKEIGIDISDHASKSLTDFLGMKMDLIVTVCNTAKENCPIFPGGGKSIHKGFKDPSSIQGTEEEILRVFREVRDEIISWIESELVHL